MEEEYKFSGTPLNPLFDQMNHDEKTITSLNIDWEYTPFETNGEVKQ